MGFEQRKKSGNIFAGSRLVVDGQGIYNVKILKFSPERQKTPLEYFRPIVFPKPIPAPLCDFNGLIFITPTPTPTITPTPTMTPTPTPTEINSDICFTLSSEGLGLYSCTIGKSGFLNGKPYYQMLMPDCTSTEFYTGYVWWDDISNQWNYTRFLGDNTTFFYGYNENPSFYPVSDITYPWIDVSPTISMISSTLGDCPPTEVCFTLGYEAIGGLYSCTISSSGVFASKPYYEILDIDCTTPLGFVWWNAVSGQWEFTDLLGDLTGGYYAYNQNPSFYPLSDITYPWVIINGITEMYSTLGNCCVCVKLEYIESATYGGTYLDCNNTLQNWIIAESGGLFTFICTSNPDSITWNIQPDSITINGECINNECFIPTPTPTPTVTNTPTITPTNTVTPTITVTPTPAPDCDFTGIDVTPQTFISVWVTSYPDEVIDLPYEITGTYDGIIDWGDGNTSVNSFTNKSHTYSTPGTYTISITGTLIGWSFFNNFTSVNNLTEILQWGCLRLGNSGGYFGGCNNLSLSNVTDILNLSGTTDLSNMFYETYNLTNIPYINSWDTSLVTNMSNMFYATSFNQDIGGWVTSGVTNMGGMFQSTPFNQDIGNWDVSSVINTSNMFNNALSFNNGGSPSISGWTTSSVTDMSFMFSSSPFNQPIGNWDVSNVTNMGSMFYFTTSFNQDIGNWNVGNVIDMSLMFLNTSFNNGGSPSISGWTTLSVTDMSFMFSSSLFNQDIGNWNVSNVIDMNSMFQTATVFNQDIGNWNVSNVIDMNSMFQTATVFNQDIGGWDVSSVTNMVAMFAGASSFNQPLGNWNVSNVTNMNFMFSSSLFNQPIGNWNVSNVTNMGGMFQSTPFNQDIGNWDVSSVINTSNMFNNASSFNNGGSPSISGWTTSSVTDMNFMFNSSLFNQNIGNWDVGNVTNMGGMFQATPFNQDIGNWNVSNVTSMSAMFLSSPFNQDIGNWNISGVTGFFFFMNDKTPSTFSTTNLDSIYNGWSTKNPKPNLNINFGTAKYTSAGQAGKDVLTGSTMSGGYGWTITDGGI
jgi:surface protein